MIRLQQCHAAARASAATLMTSSAGQQAASQTARRPLRNLHPQREGRETVQPLTQSAGGPAVLSGGTEQMLGGAESVLGHCG